MSTKIVPPAQPQKMPTDSPTESSGSFPWGVLSPWILCGVTALILGRTLPHGDFWWSDAGRHVMNGVFIYDVFRDLPLRHLREYALRYYAQYPALNFGMYPPFFPLVEALFFSVFGISAWVARLTVLAFGLLGVVAWYQWIRRLAGAGVAFVSAVMLITAPTVVLWAREVMLEMPTLALLIAACFFTDRYVHWRNPRFLYLGVILSGLAAWTKQPALFVLPVLAIYVTWVEGIGFWRTRRAWVAIAWEILLVAPLCGYILYLGGVVMRYTAGRLSEGHKFLRGLEFFLTELPRAVGGSVIVLSCIGLTLMLRSSDRKRWGLLFVWTVIGYLFISYTQGREGRYIYFWLPPFALFAAWGAIRLTSGIPSRAVAYSLLGLFCVYRVAAAFAMPVPYVSGYEPAAAYVAAHPKGHVVLFDGYYNGCFIFHLRRYDPHKTRIALRADKMFNPAASMKEFGQVVLVHSKSDIRRLLDDYGVNQIVVENGPPQSPASRMLREIVGTEGEFTFVKRWRLVSKNAHNTGDSLLLYERRRPIQVRKSHLRILIPAFDRQIEVPLQPLSDNAPAGASGVRNNPVAPLPTIQRGED